MVSSAYAQRELTHIFAVCGGISEYGNMGEKAKGVKNWEMILMRRVTVQGFVVVDHLASVELHG